ncbi:hypothetical protein CRG98_014145 [Punica granatum]|uniref:Uncharacterized protein n=1 Tax=Punica granatum TaxID=22663 RepID=A0A2I0KAC3_PUNGR|nr:hypothetical protein CRG98_014145 [Punica granatum]
MQSPSTPSSPLPPTKNTDKKENDGKATTPAKATPFPSSLPLPHLTTSTPLPCLCKPYLPALPYLLLRGVVVYVSYRLVSYLIAASILASLVNLGEEGSGDIDFLGLRVNAEACPWGS